MARSRRPRHLVTSADGAWPPLTLSRAGGAFEHDPEPRSVRVVLHSPRERGIDPKVRRLGHSVPPIREMQDPLERVARTIRKPHEAATPADNPNEQSVMPRQYEPRKLGRLHLRYRLMPGRTRRLTTSVGSAVLGAPTSHLVAALLCCSQEGIGRGRVGGVRMSVDYSG